MINNFPQFARLIEANFNQMSGGELFVVDSDRDTIWQHYLASFPEGTNPIFRERTEHDCSCCKNFIRNIGNVVAIVDGRIRTIWSVAALPAPYDVVARAMDEHVRSLPIRSVFRTKEFRFGAGTTPELLDDGTVINWEHFHGKVSDHHHDWNADTTRGRINSVRGVLKRGLEELKPSDIQTVLDLIEENALYRGAEHKAAVVAFRKLQKDYAKAKDKDLFIWENVSNTHARFRNTVIGTLVQDLSDGKDLEIAVKSFETKVAPHNYKRPTALITPRMIEAAVGTLKDMGLETAVERRFARIEDVSVNNVLFVDNSVQDKMQDGLTGLLMEEVKSTPVSIDNAPSMSMNDFMNHVLPEAKKIELLVSNQHLGNFMSITAPVHQDTATIFKWDNNFAWSYDGDITDSVKQRVKAAGGRVDARFRVSLGWYNFDDLDIHVHEPDGNHIYYGHKCGKLDVDMNAGHGQTRDAVENVCWDRLKDGDYRVVINNYTRRESIDVGFELDVEFDGVSHKFFYPKPVRGDVKALAFRVKNGQVIQVGMGDNNMVAGSSSQEKWGVKTETLVQVDTLMASPNHWDGREVGNKHWFFILKDCLNPDETRGIYNEFLMSGLDQHRKVFEVLGAKTKCPVSDKQLSGVGFSSTRGDSVVAVVSNGSRSRAITIQF